MTTSGMEAWVTAAVDEMALEKVILLAGSLRRVATRKKIVVLAMPSLMKASGLGDKLREVFDLVVPLVCPETRNGLTLTLEEHARLEGFSLLFFQKCVYISPCAIVLKNCDEIFDKYGNFAAVAEGDWVDSSVYLFTPSMDSAKALEGYVNGMGGGSAVEDKSCWFGRCFHFWAKNNMPAYGKLDGEYNTHMNLNDGTSLSLSSKVSIANLGEAHPLDFPAEWVDERKPNWGPIENFAVGLCKDIVGGIVRPGHEIYSTEPIAIIGISFRLPGGNNPDEFWDLLVNGKEAIVPVPESRWTREHTHFPCQNRQMEAGFLSTPVDEFDAKFFRINGKEAALMDPQHRLLHEVAWEAMEDAMVDPLTLRDTRTGIFVGSWLQDYRDMGLGTSDWNFFKSYMATSIATGAARLSHFFETTGAAIATETGCSSAIVAVDMACKSLRNRDSNLAFACGVSLLLKPFDHNTLSFIVSREGRCKTFDEGANGYGRAEGCAVLLMKRLSDAERDGDNIWALIRGSAVTQEGVSNSLGTPTVHCEALAMDLALKEANVEPANVSFVEAHGTGTPVGDPLEIEAITRAYSKGRSEPLVIGSVKTNVGHTEAVSGITGIIKVILSMKNEKIPPHLNLTRLNPAINLGAIPAIIPLEVMSWPREANKPRIAGVSSFGIGGTDGHVIIQEPPQISQIKILGNDACHDIDRPLHIMSISTKSPESLQQLLTTYESIFDLRKEDDNGFADIAYSANVGRATFDHRVVITARNFSDAANALRQKSFKTQANLHSSGGQGKLCFLFTGQGSQYPKMGATLYATSPIFRDAFVRCDKLLTRTYGINLREVLWGDSSTASELSRTLYSQTSLFCIAYCLLQLWESWGVKPDYVLGHSMGETAAAVAAGALSFEEALKVITERSRLVDVIPRGKMLVIQADMEAVDKLSGEWKQTNPNFWIDYAALNSPQQTVIAGDPSMIDDFAQFCKAKSLKTTVLAATHAFHSRHMDQLLKPYREVVQAKVMPHRRSNGPKYISGMDGKLVDVESINVDYWVRHARKPVNFMGAIKVAQSEGCNLFLEVGPHPVLSALTMLNYGDRSPVTCLPSLRRKEDAWVTMLDSLAKLHLSDWKGSVDWKGFDRYYQRSKVTLPFYPFNRKPFWKDLEGTLPIAHPLLGRLIPNKSDHTILEEKLTLKSVPYVQDHVIGTDVIFPGAAFLEMCLVGGQVAVQGRRSSQRPVTLKSFKIQSPLAMYDSGYCRLQTTVKLDDEVKDGIQYSVSVHRYVTSASDQVGEWVTHATGKYLPVTVEPSTSHIDIQSIQGFWQKIGTSKHYEELAAVGLCFGSKFRSIGPGWKSEKGILFTVNQTDEDAGGYLLHPLLSDAMIQAAQLWTQRECIGKPKLQVPIQIDDFTWIQSSSSASPARYVYCQSNDEGKTICILLDEEGNNLARMTGVVLVDTSVKLFQSMIHQQKAALPKLWREIWKHAPGVWETAYALDHPTPHLPNHGLTDIGEDERSFHEYLCKLARLFFLNAMYEMGWEPKEKLPFTVDGLSSFLPNATENNKKYIRSFLRALVETGMIVEDKEVGEEFYFDGLPPTRISIEEGLRNVTIPPEHSSRVEYQLIMETGRCLPQIWHGTVEPLQVLFPDDSKKAHANQLYKSFISWGSPIAEQMNNALFTEVFDKANNPGGNVSILRVLEVGSGTGAFSERFLECAKRWGKPFQYYFTDVSTFFLRAAEVKFEPYSKNMVFQKFNIEIDPLVQGFRPAYFDMILASDVIHTAKDIRKTVRNLRRVLKPGGWFQIVETTMPDTKITQIFGQLEGYWHFEDTELRPYHATLSPSQWEHVLKELDCDKVVCTPFYNNVHSFITARLSPVAKYLDELEAPSFSWLIFYHDGNTAVPELLKSKLMGVNRKVRTVRRPSICTEKAMHKLMESEFQNALDGVRNVEGVIYLWGLAEDADEVSNRDQSQISLPLINLLQRVTQMESLPRLYVVTRGAACDGINITDPNAGTLHGILRSITNEVTELHLSYLDLSPDQSSLSQSSHVFDELWTTKDDDNSVITFRGNDRLRMKLSRAGVSNNEPLSLPSGCDRFQLLLPTTRLIADLELGPLGIYTLEGNEVEVELKAVALNFRDVLTVQKPIPEFEQFNNVGLDFSGVITRVGGNVTKRRVGDRVIGLNLDPQLSMPSHIKVQEQFAVPLPSSFNYAEGATLPLVYSTAFYCLVQVGGMKRGDTVLIHTASGGVGLCAIQLAKRFGATVIATAGSQRKQKYLRNLGIEHVFHSRTTHFGKEILEVTNGRGVDIVLNSITGEGFKEASLSTLAKEGRFIEMSKLNVWTAEEVKQLRPDVFYQIVDLTALKKSKLLELMGHLENDLEKNTISPIPYGRFDALNIRGALEYLQHAKHIGKIVCVMPELRIENSKITATTQLFNDSSTYLVTGGLGGIGFEVVKWMLSSGAKHVAIVSRSLPSPDIKRQLESWNKSGKHVEAFSLDIGNEEQCRLLFQELNSPDRGFPMLRGVMHAAGVLADALIENQTWEKFIHCYKSKVEGTWNLHDMTKDLNLEHFVLFSSVAAVIGPPGQSNHSAANRFQDTLASYRRSIGLPATSINWANWGEVGSATTVDFPGMPPFTTSQGILALETILKTQESHLSVANFESFSMAAKLFPSLQSFLEDKRLFGQSNEPSSIINSDAFWKEVDTAEDGQGKLVVIKDAIKSVLRNLLKMERGEAIDELTDFQTFGVDSLMILELKNGLQNILGTRMILTVGQLRESNSTSMLANLLVNA